MKRSSGAAGSNISGSTASEGRAMGGQHSAAMQERDEQGRFVGKKEEFK